MLPTLVPTNSPPRRPQYYMRKKKKVEAAAEVPAAAPAAAESGDVDLISDLPDAMLTIIISLLPTKDGARTQILAQRWRHLWSAAPLNLRTGYRFCRNELMTVSVVSRILSAHPGPARSFCCRYISLHKNKQRRADDAAQIERWFRSPALTGLQELYFSFFARYSFNATEEWYQLPESVLLLAPTLAVAEIGICDFPTGISPSLLQFPALKQLTLYHVFILEDVLHEVLSGCHVLESLVLKQVSTNLGSLRISSSTLRSIGFCAPSPHVSDGGLLVIEDAPCLERLLVIHPGLVGGTIRVIRAPKLEIIGPLSPHISELQISNLVLQGMIPATSLKNSTCIVKVLALQFSGHCLSPVLDVLRCFPCLETLYVFLNSYGAMDMQNVRQCDPLDPINCLETRLEKLVLDNYEGHDQDVGFAHFFILNAKVLKEIKFGINKKAKKRWLTGQHRLLELETRASLDAQFKVTSDCSYFRNTLDTHDLSIDDPFEHRSASRVDDV